VEKCWGKKIILTTGGEMLGELLSSSITREKYAIIKKIFIMKRKHFFSMAYIFSSSIFVVKEVFWYFL
jgi:hypothetical protein